MLNLVERLEEKSMGVVREGLPKGVLCRVTYPICNIDLKNANNRVYERQLWDMVLSNPVIKERLEKRCMFGQAEHPESVQGSNEKASHVMSKVWIDENINKVKADFDVLDTPAGRIIDTMLLAECNVGVSTRAKGELEEKVDEATKGKYYRVIPEKYEFGTVDFTSDPSTYGAYPEKVLRNVIGHVKAGLESKAIDLGYARTILESIKTPEAQTLLESVKKELNETQVNEVTKVLKEKELVEGQLKEANKNVALAQAERDTAMTAVKELEIKNSTLAESYSKDVQGLTVTIEESTKKITVLETQVKDLSKKEKDLQAKLDESAKNFDQKIKENKEQALKESGRTWLVSYRTKVLGFYGLNETKDLPEKTRALLEQASSFEEVDKLVESIKDLKREGRLHSDIPKSLQVNREALSETIDREGQLIRVLI